MITLNRLWDRSYREVGNEVDTVKEIEIHRYVLEYRSGMLRSILNKRQQRSMASAIAIMIL